MPSTLPVQTINYGQDCTFVIISYPWLYSMVIRLLDQFTYTKRSQAYQVVRICCPRFNIYTSTYMRIAHYVMLLPTMHLHAVVNLYHSFLSISMSKKGLSVGNFKAVCWVCPHKRIPKFIKPHCNHWKHGFVITVIFDYLLCSKIVVAITKHQSL